VIVSQREFIAEVGHYNPRGTWTVGRPREVLTFADRMVDRRYRPAEGGTLGS